MRTMWLPALSCLCACSDSEGVIVKLQGVVSEFGEDDPAEGATVTLVDDAGAALGDGSTDEYGQFAVAVAVPYDEAGTVVHGRVEHPDYVGTDFWQTFRIADPENSSVAIIPGRVTSPRGLWLSGIPLAPLSDQPGTISGRVFDAVQQNQVGVGGLTIELREGVRPPIDAPVVATTTTAEGNGAYVFASIPAGTYTAFVEGGDDWLDSSFTVVSLGGSLENAEQNGATSAVLDEGELRVVLSWGESPADLDAHMTGPTTRELDGEEERLHVYFGAPDDPAGLGADADVFLDVDDTSSFGPETVTVHRMMDGVYRYSVHDFTNRQATSSAAMSASRARVQLFVGRDSYEVFDVVPGRGGTNWTVFEIDGATGLSYLVNEFAYTADPGDVTAF